MLACLVCLAATRAHAVDADEPDLAQAEARLDRQFRSRGIAYPPSAVTLIALKAEGRLELWADGGSGWRFVRSYLVRATSGLLGPKLRQGDHQVPEGVYRIDWLNPHSLYHLSLHVDYPNAFDEEHAREEGRTSLGGDIMIHGDRVSDGCLPVGDDAIEELFALASRIGVENVAVVISPVDLRRTTPAAAAARSPGAPPWLRDLYTEIAGTLRAFPAPGGDAAPAAPRLHRTHAAPSCRPYDAADCAATCRRGDTASCARAAMLYGDGRGVPRDAAKAWTLASDACTHGDAVGCAVLSGLLVSDDGMRRDAARAADLARAACAAGDGHGCAQLAELCTDHVIYPRSPDECSPEDVARLRREAVGGLQYSCGGWAAYDCFTLAAIYASGDPVTAERFAAGSCAAGDPGGCDELGTLYEQQGESEQARALYARACAAGYAKACQRGEHAAGRLLASRGPTGG